MTSEWRTTKLSNVAKIVGGGTPSTTKSDYWNGNIPWITPRDLSDHKDKYISRGSRTITDLGLEESSAKLVPKGTVLYTSRAPIGYVAIASQSLCTNQGFKSLVLNEGYDSRFFYYLLKHHTPEIESRATGTTFKEISGTALANYEVKIPPQQIQINVANFLAAIDDLITQLRETNKTLEAIATGVFKSWFVNFDPVRAKQEGKKPEGMDEATASLFPDNFEQSELGEIPKGWYYGKIGDVATVKSGFAFKGQSFSDSGLPVIKIKNILGDGTVDLQNIQYIKSNIANVNKKFSLNDGDIIIAMTGATIGKTGIVVKDELTPYLNQRVAKFDKKLDGPNNGWFIYTAFQNKNISEQVLNIASGSAQPNISTSGIESIRLIIPRDLTIIDIFNTFSYSLFENWILNQKKIATLSKIFDILLPRLISGQIRLSDEEEINSKIKVDA